jgi:hypothetical protein
MIVDGITASQFPGALKFDTMNDKRNTGLLRIHVPGESSRPLDD